MSKNEKIIYCPSCKEFLSIADKFDERTHYKACSYCRKWIWYVPKTDHFEIHKLPERKTSSGVRFY